MPSPYIIGILRETRQPPDLRVPLSPDQCRTIMQHFPQVEFRVQPSPFRCFTDGEYLEHGIFLTEDLSDCQLILGVKEVDYLSLLQGRQYMFFAHVGKQQAHNRKLLKASLESRITLIDYEYLTDENGVRLVAFGHWAGIVGAYNALKGWGIKQGLYELKPAWQCHDYKELLNEVKKAKICNLRVLLTGEGRVASGVRQVLEGAGIRQMRADEFLKDNQASNAYCQLGPQHYVVHREGKIFEFQHFVLNPGEYASSLLQYLEFTDLLITGHFWDPRSPACFSREDTLSSGFRPSLIADISCDIGGPVPTTLRASSIRQPFYDVARGNLEERPAFTSKEHITVMAVDNLPAELPRDASCGFGDALLRHVLPEFFKPVSTVLDRGTIAKQGKLNKGFEYLRSFVQEE